MLTTDKPPDRNKTRSPGIQNSHWDCDTRKSHHSINQKV